MRDYGVQGQIGLENTPQEYITRLIDVFHEVQRVLKPDGTLWIVIADSYAGSGKGAAQYSDNAMKYKQGTNRGMIGAVATTAVPKVFDGIKPKDLIGVPWMLAFALRADGWYLRQDIIWHKTNAMPESVKDRCTKSHEYIFLLSKSKKYYFDSESIMEKAKHDGRKETFNKGSLKYCNNDILPNTNPQTITMAGRAHERWHYKNGIPVKNKRDVWSIPTKPYKGAHFATFPDSLVEPCILAGSRAGGTVLDPFCGSGTTLQVATLHGRNGIGIELNPVYEQLIHNRIGNYVKEVLL